MTEQGPDTGEGSSDAFVTLLPRIGILRPASGQNTLDFPRLNMTLERYTTTVEATDSAQSLGRWTSHFAVVESPWSDGDIGPLSGRTTRKYSRDSLVWGTTYLLVTDVALVAGVRGESKWGNVGKGADLEAVWRWDYEHIDEIVTDRTRKFMKVWDVGVDVRCHEPKANLSHVGTGPHAGPFMTRDRAAKDARIEKSTVLGFASTLATAAAAATGRTVTRTTKKDGPDILDTFTLS